MVKPPPEVRRGVAIYLLAGAVWIVGSTMTAGVLSEVIRIPPQSLEIAKGLAFVLVTGAVLTVALTRTHRTLRATEERFHTLAESVREGLYIQRVLPERRFVFVNPALETATGVPADVWYRDASIGRRRIHPDDVDAVAAALDDPASATRPVVFRWLRPDGQWRWLEITETPEYDSEGRSVSVQGVAVDVTARQRREAALADALATQRRATEELERLQGMQRAFLQAVSHDLRTPLTSILGLAETLERYGPRIDDAERGELHRRLEHSARRLAGLLDDLLDVDRLIRGVIEPRRRRVDLAALVRETVTDLDLSRHDVSLPDEEVDADVDPAQVARIVENLVANAVKHTPPGTAIEVSCRTSDGGVELVVADSGPGLPADHDGDVFAPFVRAPASGEHSPGSGIGLALVREFARIHGGDAWHESKPGGGLRFVVSLPSGPGRDAAREVGGV